MGRLIRITAKGILFLSLAMVLPLTPARGLDDASNFLNDYAMKLYKKGETAEAIEQLQRALMVNPRNTYARQNLQMILSGVKAQEILPASRPQQAPAPEIFPQTDRYLQPLDAGAADVSPAVQDYQNQIASLRAENRAKEERLTELSRLLEEQKATYQKQQAILKESVLRTQERIERLQKELLGAQPAETGP